MTGTEARHESVSFDLMSMDRQIQRRLIGRRALRAAAMLGVAAVGLRRGGVLGWAAAGFGLSALGRELLAWLEARPEWRKGAAIPLRRLFEGDLVDKTSVGSFPASDAPSHDLH